MSGTMNLIIDGKEIVAELGQTIMQAADAAGIYIPRLCAKEELHPYGGCRICSVKINGRYQAACTQPAGDGMIVDNNTEEVMHFRRNVLEMLFVEGNHFCMFCEKSGNCELQAVAYRFGITASKYPYLFPVRAVDASHPDIYIDHNRCIQCARCIRASLELDGKNVFQMVGRGPHMHVGINAPGKLSETNMEIADKAAAICPVGAIIRKRVGYQVPVGERKYDHKPIGSEIEARQGQAKRPAGAR